MSISFCQEINYMMSIIILRRKCQTTQLIKESRHGRPFLSGIHCVSKCFAGVLPSDGGKNCLLDGMTPSPAGDRAAGGTTCWTA